MAGAWSLPFRPRCAGAGAGGGSALVFPVGNPWLCGTPARAEYLRTRKAWKGCNPALPGGGPMCGFEQGSLTVLTDARCVAGPPPPSLPPVQSGHVSSIPPY